MKLETLRSVLGRSDIYLIDQLMKGLYRSSDCILDAGCGNGRHIDLFYRLNIEIHGIDMNPVSILKCQERYATIAHRIQQGGLIEMPYEDGAFDHIISSAVFHFARSKDHFVRMFSEHIRVLKSRGSLFIRMTTKFGLKPDLLVDIGDGVYRLPDGTNRFLMTYDLIDQVCDQYNIQLLETIKTVNVKDRRAMGVLLFEKR